MRQRPLIAHIIFRLHVGGLENGLVNLINRMPNDFEHAIVCLKDYSSFRNRIRKDSVAVFALHKREGKDLRSHGRLFGLLRRLRPAIVHTRNIGTIDCGFIAWLAGVPKRIHGLHGWDVADLHGKRWKTRTMMRLSSRYVDRYVAVSDQLRRWAIDECHLRSADVMRIYNGVDAERFQPAVRRAAGLPEGFCGIDRFLVGSVGRLEPVKDQLTLLRAFALLVSEAPGGRQRCRLALVGGGSQGDLLDAEARTLGVRELIWLAGDRDDVADILPGFSVFVLPSLNEGISNTVLEAMASGLPVVATAVGGNVELVDDGRTGFLVQPSSPRQLCDRLLAYYRDAALRQAHGSAAALRARDCFSIDAMVAGYMALYHDTLADSAQEKH